ncbi:MAG: dTMP kinase [Myxococcota bacterium]
MPFIVFEGIDGAGTTTQVARLAAELRREGRTVHTTREPSDGPVGVLLRRALSGDVDLGGAAAMALLFAADRLEHVAHEIDPRARDGAVVICDRYDLSSIAYQTATASEAERPDFEAWVRDLNRYARRPDATVILHVDPAVAAQRRMRRLGAPELYERAALQRELAILYREAERLRPEDRYLHIEGDADEETVALRVRKALAPFFHRGAVGGDER